MSKNKLGFYSGLTFTIILFLSGGLASAQWNEPTQPPPGNNVPAPINVGTDEQYKQGSLLLGGSALPITSGARLEVRGGNYGIIGFGGGSATINPTWEGLFTNKDSSGLYGQSGNFGIVGVAEGNDTRAGVFGYFPFTQGYGTYTENRYGVLGKLGGPITYSVPMLEKEKMTAMRAETGVDKQVAFSAFSKNFYAIEASSEIPSGSDSRWASIRGKIAYADAPNYDRFEGNLGYFDHVSANRNFGVYGKATQVGSESVTGYGVGGEVTGDSIAGVYGNSNDNVIPNIGVGGMVGVGGLNPQSRTISSGVIGSTNYREDASDPPAGGYTIGTRNYGVAGIMEDLDRQLQAQDEVEMHNYAGYFEGSLVATNYWHLWHDNDNNFVYDTGDDRFANFIADPMLTYGQTNKAGIVGVGAAALDVIQRKNHVQNLQNFKLLGALSVEEDKDLNGIYSIVSRLDFPPNGFCEEGGCTKEAGVTTSNELGIDSLTNTTIIPGGGQTAELTGGRAPIYAHNMLNVGFPTGQLPTHYDSKISALVAHQSGNILTRGFGYGIYAKPGAVKGGVSGSATAYGIYTSVNEDENQHHGNAYALYADASMGDEDDDYDGTFTKYAAYFNGNVYFNMASQNNQPAARTFTIELLNNDSESKIDIIRSLPGGGGPAIARIFVNNEQLHIDPVDDSDTVVIDGNIEVNNLTVKGSCTGC